MATATVRKSTPRKSTAKPGGQVQITFTFDRSTKNTHRFTEVSGEGEQIVGTLYMQKSVFGTGDAPETITVTVTY